MTSRVPEPDDSWRPAEIKALGRRRCQLIRGRPVRRPAGTLTHTQIMDTLPKTGTTSSFLSVKTCLPPLWTLLLKPDTLCKTTNYSPEQDNSQGASEQPSYLSLFLLPVCAPRPGSPVSSLSPLPVGTMQRAADGNALKTFLDALMLIAVPHFLPGAKERWKVTPRKAGWSDTGALAVWQEANNRRQVLEIQPCLLDPADIHLWSQKVDGKYVL